MRSKIAVLFIPFVFLAATVATAQTQGASPGVTEMRNRMQQRAPGDR